MGGGGENRDGGIGGGEEGDLFAKLTAYAERTNAAMVVAESMIIFRVPRQLSSFTFMVGCFITVHSIYL